jgi:hypothetical protein
MTNIDTAVVALREANPVPDVEGFHEFTLDAARFLEATRERNERMDTLEKEQTTPVRQRWGLPAVAVAAFVIVLGVGIAMAVLLAVPSPSRRHRVPPPRSRPYRLLRRQASQPLSSRPATKATPRPCRL